MLERLTSSELSPLSLETSIWKSGRNKGQGPYKAYRQPQFLCFSLSIWSSLALAGSGVLCPGTYHGNHRVEFVVGMDNGCFAVMIKSRFTSVSQKIIYWQWSFHRNRLWLVSLPIIIYGSPMVPMKNSWAMLGHTIPPIFQSCHSSAMITSKTYRRVHSLHLNIGVPQPQSVESWDSCGFVHNKIGWFINVYHLPPKKSNGTVGTSCLKKLTFLHQNRYGNVYLLVW